MAGESFKELILGDKSFFIRYVSIWYPFKAQELTRHWDKLYVGDAFYSHFERGDDTVSEPEVGLFFNQSVDWNDPEARKLAEEHIKSKGGEGADISSLPLSLEEEVQANDKANWAYSFSLGDRDEMQERYEESASFLDIARHEYPELSVHEAEHMINTSPSVVRYNRSIWEKTFRKEISAEMVEEILG